MHRIVSGRTRRFLRWKACTEEMARTRVTAIEITGTGPLSSWEFRFLLVLHMARIIWLPRWMHIGHSMGSTTIARNSRITIPHCRIVRAAGGWSPNRYQLRVHTFDPGSEVAGSHLFRVATLSLIPHRHDGVKHPQREHLTGFRGQ